MLLEGLLTLINDLAPAYLAEEWDNSGLQVGDRDAVVKRVLACLDVTQEVIEDAIAGEFDTIIAHHPLLFTAVRTLDASKPKERMLRTCVRHDVNVVSCHTNLDAAAGGIADIAAEALGLVDTSPLEPAAAGWLKLVGFIPSDAVDRVAAAVFAAGAGGIGDYSECAFASMGTGWFTPGAGARPAVGEAGRAERTPETRWETVLPKARTAAVVQAYLREHPYEEPAFDLYPIQDVLPSVGLGRVGDLATETTVEQLAQRVTEVFELETVTWSGAGDRKVRRIGVLPGSGRGSLESAAGRCEVLVTGDLGYHDGERASERGLTLVNVPHDDFEWWAFRRWCGRLNGRLKTESVEIVLSAAWRRPWTLAQAPRR